MSFSGQKIVVIGASGSLGSEISKELAKAGAVVLGTASSSAGLARIPEAVSNKYVVDLAEDNSVLAFANQLASEHGYLDGVVVAAGVVGFNLIEENDSTLAQKMMKINFSGPANLISQLFPLLKNHTNEKAFVVGITGVVVEQTFPGMSIYSASKNALSSFLQSIDKEWRRYKIKALDVRLGHTETGLATRPLFGTAPNMPTGHSPESAIEVMVNAIKSDARIISSSEFNSASS